MLACPIDATALTFAGGTALVCERGHSFDRAREGYYNLLVVQHKASRDPGDTKAMVAARRRVLEAGIYAPIATHMTDAAAEFAGARQGSELCIADAGCGDGYYLQQIENRLAGRKRVHLAGLDISKWAVQAAAKRTQGCFWAVATNRHLPFASGRIDLIISMFGFPVWHEFARTQPEGGSVLLVDPAAGHLIELRSIIYPTVNRSDAPALPAAASKAGYRLTDEHRLTFQVALQGSDQISDLLAMTPHGHRAPIAGREALAKLDRLPVTADVVIRRLSLNHR